MKAEKTEAEKVGKETGSKAEKLKKEKEELSKREKVVFQTSTNFLGMRMRISNATCAPTPVSHKQKFDLTYYATLEAHSQGRELQPARVP